MRVVCSALAVALCLLGSSAADAIDYTMWLSPLEFRAGTPSVTIASSVPAASIRITTSSPGDAQWAYLGLELPSNVWIDSVTVCYELADPTSFISELRLTSMRTPDFMTAVHVDTTDLRETGVVCHTSVATPERIPIDGTMTLALRLNFASASHWVDFGAISVHVSDVATPVHLSRFTAVPRWQQIQIEWETSSVLDHAGFNLYRQEPGRSDYEKLNRTLITGGGPYRFVDSNVRPNTTYAYKLRELGTDGRQSYYGPVFATSLAWGSGAETTVQPNPSSGNATVSFELDVSTEVVLGIYDVSGRLVKRLLRGIQAPGHYSEPWDGRDGTGNRVAPGTYFAELTANGRVVTSKVVVVR